MNLVLLFLFISFLPVSVQPQDTAELIKQSEQAKTALNSGQYEKAVSLYSNLVQALPEVPGVRMNLGIALYMSGDLAGATSELERALDEDKTLMPARLFLGSSYFQTGQMQKAVDTLLEYVKSNPEDPQGRKILADAHYSLEQYRLSAEQFQQLTRLQPADPGAWHGLGRSYEALATRAFERLQSMAPESAYWLALIADSRASQQQYKSAYFFYRQALEKNPTMRGLHVAIARIYRQTGHSEWAQAEEQKEAALGVPECQVEPLVCHFLAGRLGELVETARAETSPESFYWSTRAYNLMAMEAFSQLGRLPASFELHRLKAEVQENQGRYLEAAQEWRKALELSPENPVAVRGLATNLYLSRDYQQAEPIVNSLLEKDPASSQMNYLKGGIFLNQEKAAQAVPYLERAVQADPGFLTAHASLGRAYLSLGEEGKAVPHLEQALSTDDDGSLHYQLARAYQGSGEAEKARETLKKYQEIQQQIQTQDQRLEEELQITPPN